MPARPDLAAKHLEGHVQATRYVEGELREVVAPQAPLRQEPRLDAMLDTEALKGERVMVYDTNEEGWSWGQLQNDGYVGWLPTDALRPAGAPPTHTVVGAADIRFPRPFNQIDADRNALVWMQAAYRARTGGHSR